MISCTDPQGYITILDVIRVTEQSVATPILNMLVDAAKVCVHLGWLVLTHVP